MAEKHEHEKTGLGVYKMGEKYICEECGQEVALDEICPTCHKDLDWEKIRINFTKLVR